MLQYKSTTPGFLPVNSAQNLGKLKW